MAYVDLTSRFVYGLQTVFGDFSKLANNDKFVKENGWQDGTVGVFFQAAAPTGWTKVTTANARALRLVSGAGGGVGGTQDPSTTITLAHTHSVTNDSAHTHAIQDHTHHLATSGAASALANLGAVGAQDNGSGNELVVADTGTIFTVNTKKNALPMTGSFTSGSGGAHDHGGATDSALTDLSLAYIDVIICSKDTSTGYTDLATTFVHNTRHVSDYMQDLAQNDAFNYARRTPAGTVSLFGTPAAPTGWTKLTTENGRMVRVVSGTGGVDGGTTDPATAITLAHVHSDLTSGGAHTHSVPNHKHTLSDTSTTTTNANKTIAVSGGLLVVDNISVGTTVTAVAEATLTDGAGTGSSDGAHVHSPATSLSSISLAYFNVIQASKDSAGASQSYTDLTALFATYFSDQFLLAYQEMQLLAYNDAYLYYHTMPAAAVMFFFQAAAPLNWTKSTSHNDNIVRVVSGASDAGGDFSGSAALSTAFLLAHTHVIDSKAHTHSYSHTHTMGSGSARHTDGLGPIASRRIYGAAGADMYYGNTGGSADAPLTNVTDSQSAPTDTYTHNHGGLTGSALSNVVLAYADVIMCTKS